MTRRMTPNDEAECVIRAREGCLRIERLLDRVVRAALAMRRERRWLVRLEAKRLKLANERLAKRGSKRRGDEK
jgi:hypothetical protein